MPTPAPFSRVSPAASTIGFDELLKSAADKLFGPPGAQAEASAPQTQLESWLASAVTLHHLADLAASGNKTAAAVLSSCSVQNPSGVATAMRHAKAIPAVAEPPSGGALLYREKTQ